MCLINVSLAFMAHVAMLHSILYHDDFFQAWPADALELVANKFLEDVEMTDEVRTQIVVMCKHFHESVLSLSEK